MAGRLTHGVEVVVRQLLVDLGVGSDPPAEAWTVSAFVEPDEPDDAITVFGSAGREQGRTMHDGRRQGPLGVQVRVRSRTNDRANDKASEVQTALNESVRDRDVAVDGSAYRVQSAYAGDVITLLKESYATQRALKTVNALVHVRQTA